MEEHHSFVPLLIVIVLAFLVPFILSRFRRLSLPVVVGYITPTPSDRPSPESDLGDLVSGLSQHSCVHDFDATAADQRRIRRATQGAVRITVITLIRWTTDTTTALAPNSVDKATICDRPPGDAAR